MRFVQLFLVMLISAALLSDSVQSADCVDVAIVLAIDASNSITEDEFHLQLEGTAKALGSPKVRQAMRVAGTVAVSVIIWSDHRIQATTAEWIVLREERDLQKLLQTIRGFPREQRGNTDIGYGLSEAVAHFDSLGTCADRKVIDVSGDGVQTRYVRTKDIGQYLYHVRRYARVNNITINGLAIGEDDVITYFENEVIAGSDAFVVRMSDYQSFEEAMSEKLFQEIAPVQIIGTAVLVRD